MLAWPGEALHSALGEVSWVLLREEGARALGSGLGSGKSMP